MRDVDNRGILPETVTQVLEVNTVGLGNVMGDVRQQGNLQGTQTALAARGVDPDSQRHTKSQAKADTTQHKKIVNHKPRVKHVNQQFLVSLLYL